MHGRSVLQSLTKDELSLVEGIMSGKFLFFAKEAMGQRKGEKKQKRSMPDTFMVDDHTATRSSVPMESIESSPAMSSKKMRLSEAEGFVLMSLLSDGIPTPPL